MSVKSSAPGAGCHKLSSNSSEIMRHEPDDRAEQPHADSGVEQHADDDARDAEPATLRAGDRDDPEHHRDQAERDRGEPQDGSRSTGSVIDRLSTDERDRRPYLTAATTDSDPGQILRRVGRGHDRGARAQRLHRQVGHDSTLGPGCSLA